MESAELKDLIRARYGGIAKADDAACCSSAPAGCCDSTPVDKVDASACCAPATTDCCDAAKPADTASRAMGYSEAELAAVPEGANLGLGCGNPQAIAGLRPGEVVVDLGSGAGFDCFLAGRNVGPEGRVIGVDMTHEMLAKARVNAAKVGATNVEFRLGEIEHLPVANAVADVVISNCVVNLVLDKAQVFREAFRVLKPGGRVAISDVVNIAPLSDDLQADPALLCGCISGAIPAERVETLLHEAGFVGVIVTVKLESRDMVASWAPGRGVEKCVASAMIEARKPTAAA
jgi:SAM-dependent methyltransferase